MTLFKWSWAFSLALAAASSLAAAEINGKVQNASGDTATVVIEGEAQPAAGDSVEIFFKLAGGNDEVSVASGKVAAVEAKVVQVKIENASGTVAKDQLARIKPRSAAKASDQSRSPSSSPTGTATTSSSIVGDWVGPAPDGAISFSFKEDGNMLWEVQNAKYAQIARAKYRVVPTAQPHTIELFEMDEVAAPKGGKNVLGIFEIQSDGRLKLDFEKGSGAPPLKEFTKDALVLSKATSSFVPSQKPPFPSPSPYVAPIVPPDEKLLEEGKGLFRSKDYDGAIKAYTKAIELNPKNAEAYYWRGNAYFDKKDEPATISDYEKALELDPSMHRLLRNLIDAMKQTQRLDRESAAESPTTATPTATPAQSRVKTKRKP